MVGGHYTYAEVPLFDQLKPVFGWERNNYDKLGHFMQGFVPAILARELLIRNAVVAAPACKTARLVGAFWVMVIGSSSLVSLGPMLQLLQQSAIVINDKLRFKSDTHKKRLGR